MQIDKIKQSKLFSSLFQINNAVLSSIKEDIEANGYDSSQPIVLWQGKNLLVDGNTRFLAAKMAGVKDIPVFFKKFEHENEALAYALHNQRDRRNIADSDLLKIISTLDKRRAGKPRKTSPSGEVSIAETAKMVGMSERKVSRVKTVLADETATKEVMEGVKTLNKASEEIAEKKKIEKAAVGSTFNETNENIDWARWSWNPVTGCLAGCKYCYARDIAERFYTQKFKPTFHENRLSAPFNTTPKDGVWGKTVFVCSMADLFGDWVPKEWIEKVISVVRGTPQWNYLFLTKNPERYLEFSFPNNCWLGATADTQERANKTKEVFYQLKNFSGEYDREPIDNPLFLSCEPLSEHIELIGLAEKIDKTERPSDAGYLLPFDWVIVGGRSANTKMPAFQPEWEWVETLLFQARSAGCNVYFKPNLTVRPREYPEDINE